MKKQKICLKVFWIGKNRNDLADLKQKKSPSNPLPIPFHPIKALKFSALFFSSKSPGANQNPDSKLFMFNINELTQSAPNINLTITANDLKEFAAQLISETKAEMEKSSGKNKPETYLTGEKVMQMMNISKTTLWRWKKIGYLVPVRIGGNDRYRLSDIEKKLEE